MIGTSLPCGQRAILLTILLARDAPVAECAWRVTLTRFRRHRGVIVLQTCPAIALDHRSCANIAFELHLDDKLITERSIQSSDDIPLHVREVKMLFSRSYPPVLWIKSDGMA
jgi:hypothetical protein